MNNIIKMKSVLFLTIIALCNIPAESLPKFLRGRLFDTPKRAQLLSSVPDLYFDQRLTHFDESITTTWKQVIYHIYKINAY